MRILALYEAAFQLQTFNVNNVGSFISTKSPVKDEPADQLVVRIDQGGNKGRPSSSIDTTDIALRTIGVQKLANI